MNRSRTSRILPMVLLTLAAVWAVSVADTHVEASSQATGGAYAVTFQVSAPSTVPDGATITCKARIAPQQTAFERVLARTPQTESTPGVGTVVNSSATCTALVPYGVAAGKDGDSGELSYQIDALTAAGPVFARTQRGIGIPLPQAGTTAKLRLNVAL